ncbi:MAG: hypothetical protein NZ869_00220 [Thermoanaerobaculum sp.]|nr:hypothetical protein [Thermoanaerobaculum sp.]MDW7968566.1 DUF6580 family putative transport protein [Thermoanaerobaculum sp.]
MGRFFNRWTVAAGLIVLAALLRLVPHPPNVAPATALALFSGAIFGLRARALLLPLASMLLSDGLLELFTGAGFHQHMLAVYGALGLVVVLGSLAARGLQAGRVALASVAASTLFYLVTNFAVWAGGTLYPHTFAGLVACYAAALPFYGLSLLGDLAYTAIIFAAFAAIARYLPQPQAV